MFTNEADVAQCPNKKGNDMNQKHRQRDNKRTTLSHLPDHYDSSSPQSQFCKQNSCTLLIFINKNKMCELVKIREFS